MKDTFGNIIHTDKPVLIDFYATWCGPCQTLAPILEDFKSEMGDAVKIIKVDIDKNQELASRFKVRSVPTLMLYKEGKQLWRKSGLMSKRDLTEAFTGQK